MARPNDVVLGQLQIGRFLLERLTEDLSDADYFLPPMEGVSHVGWILGHIACSEDRSVSEITGAPPQIVQANYELFRGGSVCMSDASKYPSRKEIDELFRGSRGRTVETLQAFDAGKWGDPSPEGAPREFFPTVGSYWGMQGTHQFWHIGQIATCRAAMKKKRILT